MNYIKYQGRRMCIKHWANEVGLEYATLHFRLKAGWSIERALSEPAQKSIAKRARKARSMIFPNVQARIAKSHAALSEQLHRELRTFLRSYTDALCLHAEVAAMHLAKTHNRGVGDDFQNRPGDRWTPTAQESVEIEFSQNREPPPCP